MNLIMFVHGFRHTLYKYTSFNQKYKSCPCMVVTLTLQCFKIPYNLHENQADFQK